MKYNIGYTVVLNKDIWRLPEGPDPRVHEMYGQKGDIGVIVEIFKPKTSNKSWYSAKVAMNDTKEIKTFRLTSLDIITKGVP